MLLMAMHCKLSKEFLDDFSMPADISWEDAFKKNIWIVLVYRYIKIYIYLMIILRHIIQLLNIIKIFMILNFLKNVIILKKYSLFSLRLYSA